MCSLTQRFGPPEFDKFREQRLWYWNFVSNEPGSDRLFSILIPFTRARTPRNSVWATVKARPNDDAAKAFEQFIIDGINLTENDDEAPRFVGKRGFASRFVIVPA